MVAQDISVRRGKGLDLSGGNGGENEYSQENYDGKGAHRVQYGADPCDRQGNGGVQAALDGIAHAPCESCHCARQATLFTWVFRLHSNLRME